MAYRYRSPSLLGNLGRLSGYNANRGRTALEQRPTAAQVTQVARESEPVFETPPPAAPLRAPPLEDAPDAGLKLAPEMQAELMDPALGTLEPFARQALQRGMAQLAPMVTTNDPALAGADISTLGGRGVGELGAPDLAALSEDPLPLTPGERVGRGISDAIRESGGNPKSPDFKTVAPGIVSAAHETIRETEAQRASRAATARLKGVQADELPESAKSERGLKKSKGALADAQAGELPKEGESKRSLRTSQGTLNAATGSLRTAQALTEPDRRAELKSRVTDRDSKGTDRAARASLAARLAALKAAESGEKAADLLPGGGLFSDDQRTPVAAAARGRGDAARSALATGATLPPPPPPPRQAAAPEQKPAAAGGQDPVASTWMAASEPERAQMLDDAYLELDDPNASELDKEAARAIIALAGK